MKSQCEADLNQREKGADRLGSSEYIVTAVRWGVGVKKLHFWTFSSFLEIRPYSAHAQGQTEGHYG